MRIVYVADTSVPSRTASSVHVMKMCQAFSSNGHDVTLIARTSNDLGLRKIDLFDFYGVGKCFEVITIKQFNIKNIGPLLYSYRANKVIKKINPGLVYGRELLSCFFSVKNGFNTIYEAHQPYFKESAIKRVLISQICKSKVLINLVVISAMLKDMFVGSGCCCSNKVIVAHDAADMPLENLKSAELHGENNKLNVGYVGSLYHGKGVEIIEKIAPKLPDINFQIVGGEKKELVYWKKRITVKNVFFYGHVDPKLVPEYIKAMDVCLLPNQSVVKSHGDNNIGDVTSPLKMFEYMAHAKVIIASDLPVLREVLNNKNAILADPELSDEWVDQIKKIKKDKQLCSRLGSQAYNTFSANYTWEKRAKNVLIDCNE